MTPQEKAKELVSKVMPLCYVPWMGGEEEATQEECAKEAALIAADEVLECDLPGHPSQKEYDEFVKFWTSVKEEIQKL
jgi:hypothetical protein